MARDDHDHIPSIVPSRDTEYQPAPGAGKGRGKSRNGGASRSGGSRSGGSPGGSSGVWARLFITVSLVVAAVACAWAWQLQEQLRQAEVESGRQSKRIADLEDLLSDTDETVNQSSAAMGAQLRLLDTEVRKLWDARKKSNASIAALEKTTKANSGQLATQGKADKDYAAELKALKADTAKLKSVAGDLERLMASARANQAEVERVADTLNRINLDYAKLNKRVEGNEEWVKSINASRRQLNEQILRLQNELRSLQQQPPPG